MLDIVNGEGSNVARIFCIANQKGGVGKTTTCVNLGAALARRGFKVLLIDMDPQANLTVHLGGDLRDIRRSTYSLLLSEHALGPAVRQTATPGLRYVPSTLALANAEIQLASAVGRELLLREAIEGWLEEENTGEESPRAHFIIIDCPPSLGILTMNALCAANEVVLPIQTEFFALQGVAGILESLKAVQRLNRGLRLSMVVPCMWDRRTTLARDVVEEVEKYFGKLVAKTRIRNNVKLAEAPSHGMTIFEYDASSNGAKDYMLLAREVLGESLDDPEPKPVRAKAAPRADKAGDESDDAAPAASGDEETRTAPVDASAAETAAAATAETVAATPEPADEQPAADEPPTVSELERIAHTEAPTLVAIPTLPPEATTATETAAPDVSADASAPASDAPIAADDPESAAYVEEPSVDLDVELDTEAAVAAAESHEASASPDTGNAPPATPAAEASAVSAADELAPAGGDAAPQSLGADSSPEALAAQIDAAFAAASADVARDDYRHGL